MVLHIVHSVLSAHPPTWPNASTAGVEAGVTLTEYSGTMSVGVDGTLIENQDIDCNFDSRMEVYGDNVTFRNCIFRNLSGSGVDAANRAPGLTIDHCEFIAEGSTRTSAILGSGTFTNNNIHGCVIGIQLTDGAATVTGNYIHDLADSSSDIDDRHFDGVTLLGGQHGVLIDNNAILLPDEGTTVVFIASQFADISDVTVTSNLMMGDPSYTMYVAESGGHQITDVLVENNYLEMGFYGYFLLENNDASIVIQDNVEWDEGVDATPAAVTAWLASL